MHLIGFLSSSLRKRRFQHSVTINYANAGDVIPWAKCDVELVVGRLGRVERAEAKLQLCPRAERIPRGSSRKRTTAGPRLNALLSGVTGQVHSIGRLWTDRDCDCKWSLLILILLSELEQFGGGGGGGMLLSSSSSSSAKLTGGGKTMAAVVVVVAVELLGGGGWQTTGAITQGIACFLSLRFSLRNCDRTRSTQRRPNKAIISRTRTH